MPVATGTTAHENGSPIGVGEDELQGRTPHSSPRTPMRGPRGRARVYPYTYIHIHTPPTPLNPRSESGKTSCGLAGVFSEESSMLAAAGAPRYENGFRWSTSLPDHPRPTATGAHKRRPYKWARRRRLFSYQCGFQGPALNSRFSLTPTLSRWERGNCKGLRWEREFCEGLLT